jgi:hypothetical protein
MTSTQRRLVYFIFLYTCIEGLVVNIFYPNPVAYLPKDAVIGVLYLGLMGNSQARGGTVSKLTGLFALFAVVCVFFIAMPTPVSFMGVLVALKQRLYYIPLAFAGYHYTRGDADIATLLRVIAWSSIPVSLFGTYLFFAGPEGLNAIGANYSWAFYSTTGAAGIDHYRVPGTFNSPGQYGAFLYSVGTLLVAFLLVTDVRPKDRRMLLLALTCLLPALLTSGSRTPLLLFFVASGVVAVLSRKLSRAGIIGAVVYFVIVISIGYFGAGVGDRVSSIASQQNLERFRTTFFGQLFVSQLIADPVGTGLGTATIGARHFSPEGTVHLVESYFGVLVREMGAVGLLSFAALAVAVGAILARGRPWMKQSTALPIWNAIFVQSMLTLVLLPNSTSIDAIPMNLYFWFFVGVGIKMLDLERHRLGLAAYQGGAGGR